MQGERGMTLVEVSVVLALASLILALVAPMTIDFVQRQAARSAICDVQSHLQAARAEAVTRSQQCRFIIDQSTRRIEVVDLVDPSNLGDDITLKSLILSSSVEFLRPDAGLPITLSLLAGTEYQATFNADGSVASGTGVVVLVGGEDYFRVSLYGAGVTRVERWKDGAWSTEI